MNARSPAPPPAVVVLTVEQVTELVQQAVTETLDRVLGAQPAEEAPLLVGQGELARLLGVSRTQVTRLRKLGMPAVEVGDVHKYQPGEVLAWLKTRERR